MSDINVKPMKSEGTRGARAQRHKSRPPRDPARPEQYAHDNEPHRAKFYLKQLRKPVDRVCGTRLARHAVGKRAYRLAWARIRTARVAARPPQLHR
jgi:hypothetical protein